MGPPLKAAENFASVQRLARHEVTSMGPPLKAAENHLGGASSRCPAAHFNGAAAKSSGKLQM